jgi:hypothetical protein
MEQPSLEGAYLRVRRANAHLFELAELAKPTLRAYDELVSQNLQRQAGEVSERLKDDPIRLSVGETVKIPLGRMPQGPEVPQALSVVVGEIVYNLRAALDYLVYELAYLHRGHRCDGTQFPIEDTKKGFNGRMYARGRRHGFIQHVKPRHIAAIKKLQPCYGCDWTKQLRDLSNPDKHRRLVTTKGPRMEITDIETTDTPIEGTDLREVEMRLKTRFFIAFEDGANVVHTLGELGTQVLATLEQFKPEFEGQ